jgi:hypothetical protein
MATGFFGTDFEKTLNTKLKEKFGEDKMIWAIDNYQVYLNNNLIKEKNLDRDKIKEEVVKILKQDPTVLYAVDLDEVAEASIPEPIKTRIINGYKTIGKTEKAKADFQKAEVEADQYKKQSQLELNKTVRQLKDAENKVNLSKLALEQSQEAFRIRENRFKQGLEKTTDLLLSETQMAQKELEHLQAVFEYNFTKSYVQFLTK